jgi:tryptophan-rich sensory protein
VAGSVLTAPGSWWYRTLRKPAWQPPAAAFPVVWTTLYTAIALAATATITELEDSGRQEDADQFKAALAANLALNATWSGLFFRLHALPLAAGAAGLLAVSGADLARRASAVGKGKAGVFGAYAAWCGFATLLGAAVARRNRGR